MDIILVGKAACPGTLKAYEEHRAELKQRYSAQYLLSGLNEVRQAAESTVSTKDAALQDGLIGLVHPVCNGNLYDALWNLGESLSLGLRVRLKDIPISRFSIELGDLIDENPYLWDSTGCILIAAGEGNLLEDKLKAKGLEAKVIGYFTKDKARCIVNETGLSYIGSK